MSKENEPAPLVPEVPSVVPGDRETKKTPFSVTDMIEDIKYEVASFTTVGAVVGVSTGFYMGDLAALYGYTYGFGAGVFGVSYFGGNHLLKHFRGKNDVYNPVISGTTTGMLLGLRNGPKRAIPFALLGGAFGFLYDRMGTAMFNVTRKIWLAHRTELVNEPAKVFTHMKRTPPPREGVPEKFRFNEWNWDKKKDQQQPPSAGEGATPR
jgi:hypothetical protein